MHLCLALRCFSLISHHTISALSVGHSACVRLTSLLGDTNIVREINFPPKLRATTTTLYLWVPQASAKSQEEAPRHMLHLYLLRDRCSLIVTTRCSCRLDPTSPVCHELWNVCTCATATALYSGRCMTLRCWRCSSIKELHVMHVIPRAKLLAWLTVLLV